MFTVTTYEPGQEVQIYTNLTPAELSDMVQDLTDLDIEFTFEKQLKA